MRSNWIEDCFSMKLKTLISVLSLERISFIFYIIPVKMYRYLCLPIRGEGSGPCFIGKSSRTRK